MQLFDESHVILQAPPEQLTLHAELPSHSPSHCPWEQLQLPLESQWSDVWALPVGRGSGSGGRLLHAPASPTAKKIAERRMRIALC